MKEIIENIQMLFDNKEFTLVDELLKGQGLNYSVLNCSRLFKNKLNNHETLIIKGEVTWILYEQHKPEVENTYMVFDHTVKDGFHWHYDTRDVYVRVLDRIGLYDLMRYYKPHGYGFWSGLQNVPNAEIIELIFKLKNYNEQCGTK